MCVCARVYVCVCILCVSACVCADVVPIKMPYVMYMTGTDSATVLSRKPAVASRPPVKTTLLALYLAASRLAGGPSFSNIIHYLSLSMAL